MRRALLVALLLAASVVLSLSTGVRSITLAEALSAVTAYDLHDPAHVTLMAIRLPRLVAGLVVGAALGVAGTVMQTLTRNPLADPGILGINAGAAFALLLGAAVLGRSDQGAVAAFAFPGAALASLAVFSLGGGLRGEAGPVRLTLAGAALNALLLSMVTALVLIRQDSLDILRFWVAGSLTEAVYRPVAGMALVMLAGAALALLIAPLIEALSMGADVARGLGTQPARVQAGGLVAVTLTTGRRWRLPGRSRSWG